MDRHATHWLRPMTPTGLQPMNVRSSNALLHGYLPGIRSIFGSVTRLGLSRHWGTQESPDGTPTGPLGASTSITGKATLSRVRIAVIGGAGPPTSELEFSLQGYSDLVSKAAEWREKVERHHDLAFAYARKMGSVPGPDGAEVLALLREPYEDFSKSPPTVEPSYIPRIGWQLKSWAPADVVHTLAADIHERSTRSLHFSVELRPLLTPDPYASPLEDDDLGTVADIGIVLVGDIAWAYGWLTTLSWRPEPKTADP